MQWTCSAIARLRYRKVLSERQNEALLLAAESDDGHARSAVAALDADSTERPIVCSDLHPQRPIDGKSVRVGRPSHFKITVVSEMSRPT